MTTAETVGETTFLWRPAGPAELALVRDSGWREWPPRLPEQPIFYPVLNEDYAVRIAREWNPPRDGEWHLTRFRVRTSPSSTPTSTERSSRCVPSFPSRSGPDPENYEVVGPGVGAGPFARGLLQCGSAADSRSWRVSRTSPRASASTTGSRVRSAVCSVGSSSGRCGRRCRGTAPCGDGEVVVG